MTTILILKGGCYSLHPSNNNGIEPRMKGYLYFPRIPFQYKISRRITDHPRWLVSIGAQALLDPDADLLCLQQRLGLGACVSGSLLVPAH